MRVRVTRIDVGWRAVAEGYADAAVDRTGTAAVLLLLARIGYESGRLDLDPQRPATETDIFMVFDPNWVCPDCKGSRQYQGLFSVEPCQTCRPAQ